MDLQKKLPNRNDYIRFALDGLRRVCLPQDEKQWDDITFIGVLCNFAHAIATLYDRQEEEKKNKREPFASDKELRAFIHELAKWFDTGDPLGQAELRTTDVPPHPPHSYIPPSEVPHAFERFTQELYSRLEQRTDPKETARFYRIRDVPSWPVLRASQPTDCPCTVRIRTHAF